MSVQSSINLNLTTIETITSNVDGLDAAARKVTHNAFNISKNLTATTTPSVSQVASDNLALVAGTKTLDFTALPLVGGGTLDASSGSLKPVSILISNPAANTGTITVAAGNYTGFGAAFSHVIYPGGAIQIYTAKHASLAAVTGSVKTLSFTGTGTESFNYEVVFG